MPRTVDDSTTGYWVQAKATQAGGMGPEGAVEEAKKGEDGAKVMQEEPGEAGGSNAVPSKATKREEEPHFWHFRLRFCLGFSKPKFDFKNCSPTRKYFLNRGSHR